MAVRDGAARKPEAPPKEPTALRWRLRFVCCRSAHGHLEPLAAKRRGPFRRYRSCKLPACGLITASWRLAVTSAPTETGSPNPSDPPQSLLTRPRRLGTIRPPVASGI